MLLGSLLAFISLHATLPCLSNARRNLMEKLTSERLTSKRNFDATDSNYSEFGLDTARTPVVSGITPNMISSITPNVIFPADEQEWERFLYDGDLSPEGGEQESTSEARCCYKLWVREDQMVGSHCDFYTPQQLNWRSRCPKIEIDGKKLQTHYCGVDKDCSSIIASPPRDGDQKWCIDGMRPWLRSMDVKQLFASEQGRWSLTAKSGYKSYWKWVTGRYLVNHSLLSPNNEEGLWYKGTVSKEILLLTFGEVFPFSAYQAERKRLKAMHLIKEKKLGHKVAENSVGSICQMSLEWMWNLQASPKVQMRMRDWCGGSKYPRPIFQDALIAECFQGCLDAMETEPTLPRRGNSTVEMCDLSEMNFAGFATHAACEQLPSDTVVALAVWVIQKRCWEFPPPGPPPLWLPDDKEAVVEKDVQHDICRKVDGGVRGKAAYRGPDFGQCPEGTACECPSQQISATPSIHNLRQKAYNKLAASAQEIAVGSVGQALAIEVGQKLTPLASVLLLGSSVKLATRKDWRRLMTLASSVIVGSVTTSHTLAAGAPLFAAAMAAAVPAYLTKKLVYATLRNCEETVGCWLQKAELLNGKCIMSESAKAGGNTVWFMPPPGLQLKKGKFHSCHVEPCDFQDIAVQKVGFYSDSDLLNCQALPWEDMTSPAMRHNFLSLISESLDTCGNNSCAYHRSVVEAAKAQNQRET